MDEDEVFDLNTINEYELLSNEDGNVLIQDNCVVIKHKQSKVIKMLPLTEEVLQALGLALVLDENDVNEESNEETSMIKEEKMIIQENEDSEDDAEKPEDESITIVFTDDEEVLELSRNDTLCTSKQVISDKDAPLQWTSSMVNYLLDLYEKHQESFFVGNVKHRVVWRIIYKEMCAKYPELNNWNESNLQSKFGGLKRTYRGALEYLKENLHPTKWPYFERMHQLMTKKVETDNSAKCNSTVPDNVASEGKPASWQRKWTPLLVEVYEESGAGGGGDAFWRDIHEKMTITEPDVRAVTAQQVQQKFAKLQRSFRQCKKDESEPKGELKDIYERLSRIESVECLEESEEEEMETEDASVDDSQRYDHKVVGKTRPKYRKTTKTWSKSQTELLLDLLYNNASRFRRGAPTKIVYADISRRMRRLQGGRGPSPRSVACKVDALRRKLNNNKQSNWIFFKKAQHVFTEIGEVWSPCSTDQLLQLYAETNRLLDESGPKFWTELARRMLEKVPNGSYDSRKCEMKMQSLFVKYKSLLRIDPEMKGEAKQWRLFDRMHQIFGPKGPPWPNKHTQILLDEYRRHLPRFESQLQDADSIWSDIGAAVTAALPPGERGEGGVGGERGVGGECGVDGEGCRLKMLELKQKYCRLMKDEEAARAWPLFRRMSELFSSHLWSKTNVQLLLSLYPASGGNWSQLAGAFNALSHSSAVSSAQCQTEMHVLKARYRAVLAGGGGNEWPLFEKMHEIFGDEAVPSAKLDKPADVDFDTEVSEPEYKWTEASINTLLELYRRHRHMFGRTDRKVVWQMIDREISARHHDYRPEEEGYAGGWHKYLDMMTQYMDIKEQRCPDRDWPFYERMEALFSDHGSDADSVTSHISRDSITDNLTDLIVERIEKREETARLNGVGEAKQETDTPTKSLNTNGRSDAAILESILHEIRRRNQISQERCELMKRHHQERMAILKQIQDVMIDFVGDDSEKSDVLRNLERTLEEIHK